ncbi:MAG: PP2C family serine/threonine-protein phosphatase [Isosphaeraceae bacterium]
MNQPVEIPVFGDASLGWAFACSRKGASHRRAGKLCQDAYALGTGSGAATPYIAVAVADGHGDDRHDLSHRGSMLAVRAAVDELIALCTSYALEEKWTQLKASFKADFPRRLGRRWREAVLMAYYQRAEATGDSSVTEPEDALLIRHGTTLIAALVVGDVLLIGQIGDGGAVLVKEDGDVECPLFNNLQDVGGETDSLGSSESPRLWRTTAIERTGADLLLLATDGLINAFSDDEQWHAFARSLGDRIRDYDPSSVASALPGWLDHYSEKASGDDITLAAVVLKSPSVVTLDPDLPPAREGNETPSSKAPEHDDSDRHSIGASLEEPVFAVDEGAKPAVEALEP